MSIFDSDLAPEPVGPYPHARRVGNLLFLSGVGPRERGVSGVPGVRLDAEGRVASYDFERQCHAVMANVRHVLEASGARWEQMVDVTVFLTDMARDFGTFNRIYREYFPDPATRPCRTTLGITALPTPIAIELKVIAALDVGTGG